MTLHPPASQPRIHVPSHSVVGLALLSAFCVSAQDKATFQDHVLPLVEQHCSKCHSADKKKADLELTSYAGTLKGGGSGSIVASGSPENSKLWKALTHAEEPFMPPNRPKLGEKELDVFKRWIAGGLLESAGSKAVAATQPAVDLSLKVDAAGKPDGPPPMPKDWPLEPAVHTAHRNPITGLAASPWAPVVAVAGQKQVLVFHTETLALLGIVPFAEGQPADVKFSRSGRLLVAAGGHAAKSGRVVVWNVETAERLVTLGDEYDTVLAADIRPDQSLVALGGPSRLVKIFATGTGELRHKVKKHTDWVTAVAFSPNGECLATADRNGTVLVWDPDTAQELFTLAGHKSAVAALSWRGDSKVLASSSEDGTVKLWEMKEGKQARSWTAHGPGVLCVSHAPDGRLVTCGRDGAVTLWKADASKVRSLEFFGETPVRAVFSHDGKRIFAADFAGRVAAWNADDGQRLGELDANPAPLGAQLAAAERRVQELEPKAAASAQAVAGAETELKRTIGELESAKKTLETARADQATKENEVVNLKRLATNSPPADLDAKLAAARAARQKARETVTNATQALETRTRQVEAGRAALAKARTDTGATSLAEARALVLALQVAQVNSAAYQVREEFTRKKGEHDQLSAALSAARQNLQRAEKALASARAAAAQAEQDATQARTVLAKDEPRLKELAADLDAARARLSKLQAEQQKLKSTPTPAKLAKE